MEEPDEVQAPPQGVYGQLDMFKELADDEIDPLWFFDTTPPAQQLEPVNLRRPSNWVSKRLTNRRADWCYEYSLTHTVDQTHEAFAQANLGGSLSRARVYQLIRIGATRYDEMTAARKIRGISASESKLDWVQKKQAKLIRIAEEELEARRAIKTQERLDSKAAQSVGKQQRSGAPEMTDPIAEAFKLVSNELKRYAETEKIRVDWLGHAAPKQTVSKNLHIVAEITQDDELDEIIIEADEAEERMKLEIRAT